MESFGERLQSSGTRRVSIPGGRGLVWLLGSVCTAAAALFAIVLALALAASFVVLAVMGGGLLLLATLAMRARRNAKVSRSSDPQIIEARHIGGHSWVACGWDQGR